MKYNYELGKEGMIVLLILIGFLFLYLFGLFGYQIFTFLRDKKKEKGVKGKKITLKAYNKLQASNIREIEELREEYDELREKYDRLNHERNEMYSIIAAVKEYDIRLKELEDIGLQRYNAKYGKKGEYINNLFYEELHILHILRRKERYENNK